MSPYRTSPGRGDDAVPHASAVGRLSGAMPVHQLGWLLLRAQLRHKALAISSFTVVVTLTLGGLAAMPRRYLVETKLLVQRSSLVESLANPNLDRGADAPTRAAREVVLRRDQLVDLCRQSGFVARHLASRSPLARLRDALAARLAGREPSEEERLDALVDELGNRIWVVAEGDSSVSITAEWSDPELAYLVVESSLRRFLEARRAAEVSMVSDTVGILQAHAARIQARIADLTPKVQALEGRLQLAARASLAAEAPSAAPRDDAGARADRLRAVAELEQVRQRRLAELRAELAQQLGLYAPKHPAVEATRQRIDMLAVPLPPVEALHGEVRELERDVRRRAESSSRLTDQDASPGAAPFAARPNGLEGNARLSSQREHLDLLNRQYASLAHRLAAARVELDGARLAYQQRYAIVTPPELSYLPHWPDGRLVLLGALLGGMAQAIFVAAAAELRSRRATI